MEARRFLVGELRANPFRNLSRYPIQREKVEALRESIRATGFWSNVVARVREDGRPEIAYGHHRLTALREELGSDAEVSLIVRELDDDQMLRTMVRENMEEWGTSASVELESVRAVVEAHARGDIRLPKPPPKAAEAVRRYAPSFLKGDDRNAPSEDRAYTASSLAEFLPWHPRKIRDLLATLEAVERGLVGEEHLDALSSAQAKALTTAVLARWREGQARSQECLEHQREEEIRAHRCLGEGDSKGYTQALKSSWRSALQARRVGKRAREDIPYIADVTATKLREKEWSTREVESRVEELLRKTGRSRPEPERPEEPQRPDISKEKRRAVKAFLDAAVAMDDTAGTVQTLAGGLSTEDLKRVNRTRESLLETLDEVGEEVGRILGGRRGGRP